MIRTGLNACFYIWGAFVTVRVYLWHRREIHAGRRVPVFFGKNKHYPRQPGKTYGPFERRPKAERTN